MQKFISAGRVIFVNYTFQCEKKPIFFIENTFVILNSIYSY